MSGEVTPEDIVREVIDGLRITLTMGAARSDIGDDQAKLQELQQNLVIPMGLYQATGYAGYLLEGVTEVLGEDWKPSGEWAKYIDTVDRLSREITGE